MKYVIAIIILSAFLLMPIDTVPPEIIIDGEICVYIGEGLNIKECMHVCDNCTPEGKIKLCADLSRVDLLREGIYTARISATDLCGNTAHKDVNINVLKREITKEDLSEIIKPVAEEIFFGTDTDEDRCRAIYKYLRDNIEYREMPVNKDESESAYYGLCNFYGDCYTSYCAAKALLDFCGIKNIKVQRTSGLTQDTHFWSMVCVNGEWYHFDTTRLYPDRDNMGCLMTDKQLDEYSNFRRNYTGVCEDGYFYSYDPEYLPKISEKQITRVG